MRGHQERDVAEQGSLARTVGMKDIARIMTSRIGVRAAYFVLAVMMMSATSAQAQQYATLPERVTPLESVGGAHPIPAWRVFCERHPIECAVDPREARHIELTPQAWELLTRVNREVNAGIIAMTDSEQWGVADSWDFPRTGYGDCEDYQLLKRRRLADAGLPRRAMRMNVVLDTRNEGHAVLEIKTDRGIFILDNVTDAVLPWDETPYVYIKREGRDDTRWVSLGGVAASPTIVAGTRR